MDYSGTILPPTLQRECRLWMLLTLPSDCIPCKWPVNWVQLAVVSNGPGRSSHQIDANYLKYSLVQQEHTLPYFTQWGQTQPDGSFNRLEHTFALCCFYAFGVEEVYIYIATHACLMFPPWCPIHTAWIVFSGSEKFKTSRNSNFSAARSYTQNQWCLNERSQLCSHLRKICEKFFSLWEKSMQVWRGLETQNVFCVSWALELGPNTDIFLCKLHLQHQDVFQSNGIPVGGSGEPHFRTESKWNNLDLE